MNWKSYPVEEGKTDRHYYIAFLQVFFFLIQGLFLQEVLCHISELEGRDKMKLRMILPPSTVVLSVLMCVFTILCRDGQAFCKGNYSTLLQHESSHRQYIINECVLVFHFIIFSFLQSLSTDPEILGTSVKSILGFDNLEE